MTASAGAGVRVATNPPPPPPPPPTQPNQKVPTPQHEAPQPLCETNPTTRKDPLSVRSTINSQQQGKEPSSHAQPLLMCCDPTDSKTKPFKKLASTINSHRGMKQQGKQPRTASAKNGAVSPQPFQPLTDQACPTQQKVRRDIFGCILQRPPLPAAGPAQLAATHQDHDRTCEALTGKADTRWQQFTASTRQGNSKGEKGSSSGERSPEKRVTPEEGPCNPPQGRSSPLLLTCSQHITDTHQHQQLYSSAAIMEVQMKI